MATKHSKIEQVSKTATKMGSSMVVVLVRMIMAILHIPTGQGAKAIQRKTK